MSDGPSQLALREVRRSFLNPKAAVVLAGIGLVVAIMAPFGSHEIEPAFFRFAYWLVIVVATAVTGSFVGEWVQATLAGRAGRIAASGVAALLAACAITGVVALLNYALLGILPSGAAAVPFVTTVFAVAFVVYCVIAYVETPGQDATATPQPEHAVSKAPAILERLPADLRGALLSLSAEDHYVRVRTDKGAHLVLIRLSDAMNEAAPVKGHRVHRSHWVAHAAVQAARKDGDRALLSLTDGSEIPASRTFVPALREAGLLG